MSPALTIGVAIATPILALLGVLLGNWLTRRSAKEADVWRRREETMRLLRWAVESASSDRAVLSVAGLAVLRRLSASELLQPEDRDMVEAVGLAVRQAADRAAYAAEDELDYAEEHTRIELEEGSDVDTDG